MSFLKDSLSNPTHFKNLYAIILRLSTVYGEKLDDTVILDKKKMRRDFGVLLVFPLTYCQEIYIRLLTLSLNQMQMPPHSRATSMEGRVIAISHNDISGEVGDEIKVPGTPGNTIQEIC
jgi:hypothetical protein